MVQSLDRLTLHQEVQVVVKMVATVVVKLVQELQVKVTQVVQLLMTVVLGVLLEVEEQPTQVVTEVLAVEEMVALVDNPLF